MMPKPAICIICGTRPEIVKLAPVYHCLKKADWAQIEWIHTGQHAEMAEHMYECFGITPSFRLTRQSQDISGFSAECRLQLDQLLSERPCDLCLVQGDTESTFLGALSAFYHHIPVGHVEAGLRTNNLQRPFPEEGLRQMVARLATFHFPPTQRAANALYDEGIPPERVTMTGNTVVDAQLWAAARYGIRKSRRGRGHILVTTHRREHWGARLEEMLTAVAQVAREHPAVQVLFPVHLNPTVRVPAERILAGIPNVQLTAPLDYLGMQRAIADACLVLTDSGGLQEEAPTYGVPVLVMREETERPEAVQAGCAILAGPRRESIVHEVRRLLADELALQRIKPLRNPYGDGLASNRIAAVLRHHFFPSREGYLRFDQEGRHGTS